MSSGSTFFWQWRRLDSVGWSQSRSLRIVQSGPRNSVVCDFVPGWFLKPFQMEQEIGLNNRTAEGDTHSNSISCLDCAKCIPNIVSDSENTSMSQRQLLLEMKSLLKSLFLQISLKLKLWLCVCVCVWYIVYVRTPACILSVSFDYEYSHSILSMQICPRETIYENPKPPVSISSHHGKEFLLFSDSVFVYIEICSPQV